jgi:hypothetical protein
MYVIFPSFVKITAKILVEGIQQLWKMFKEEFQKIKDTIKEERKKLDELKKRNHDRR